MRRALAIALFAVVFLSSATNDATMTPEAGLNFERHWSPFLRKMLGCPIDPRVIADNESCHLQLGQIDYKEYRAAREAAKAMFALAEK